MGAMNSTQSSIVLLRATLALIPCAINVEERNPPPTLPMIEMLARGRAKARMPRSLILEPTRELAAQVAENFEKYGKYNHEEYPLGPGALDELSVLYYVRSLSLVEGRVVTAKVFASRKNWDLEVKVLGHETLDTLRHYAKLNVEDLRKTMAQCHPREKAEA